MNRAKSVKIIMIGSLLLALTAAQVSAAIPEEHPGAFSMIIDVPVRVLGIGLALVGTAFFIVALPFALTSWKYRRCLGRAGG